jgi:hypothetical protein
MTIFARSDVLEEGCRAFPGTSHIRPRKKNGEPIPVWGINCQPCELALAADPRWSRSRFRIPLTPDEELESKEAQRLAEAALHQQQLMLAREASNAAMAARFGHGLEPMIDDEDIRITTADDNVSGDRPAAPVTVPANRAADYGGLTRAELAELCRDRSLPATGTKADLTGRLAENDALALATR